jgi:hypothetical protein
MQPCCQFLYLSSPGIDSFKQQIAPGVTTSVFHIVLKAYIYGQGNFRSPWPGNRMAWHIVCFPRSANNRAPPSPNPITTVCNETNPCAPAPRLSRHATDLPEAFI